MPETRSALLHRAGEAGSRLGSGEARRPRVRLAIQVALVAAVFGFLIYAVASQWSELIERDVRFEPLWLLPAVLVLLVFYALAALGWDLVLRALGHELALARAQRAWAQSALARYVPGSVLLVVGRVVLAGREGVPRRTALASVAYEALLLVFSATLIGSYFFISHPDLSGQPLRWAVLAVPPLVVCLLHPRIFRPTANRLLAVVGREPLPAVIRMRAMAPLLAYYVLLWIFLGIGIFLAARSVYSLGITQLPEVAAAQALGFCAAAAIVVFPGGLGVRDGAFAWALKSALPGHSFALAAAIAIAVRLVLLLVEIAYAGLATVLGRRSGPPRSSSGGRTSGATTSAR